MFSSQIGSPAGRRPFLIFQNTSRTPMHFRRHNGPLFPSTPQRSPVSASPISSVSRPLSPFDAFPNTPRFQSRISNFLLQFEMKMQLQRRILSLEMFYAGTVTDDYILWIKNKFVSGSYRFVFGTWLGPQKFPC